MQVTRAQEKGCMQAGDCNKTYFAAAIGFLSAFGRSFGEFFKNKNHVSVDDSSAYLDPIAYIRTLTG